MFVNTKRSRLTPDDWTRAALAALDQGGLAAVAVEPLAIRLGATKGSFYSHFPSRDGLVLAVLTRWEQQSTEALIAAVEKEPDPVARLRLLFTAVTERVGQDRVEVHLRAAAEHSLVAPVLRRVMDRRIAYTIGVFEEIGFTRGEAVRRGMLGCMAYVGHSEVTTRIPGALPMDDAGGLPAYVDAVLDLLLRDAPEGRSGTTPRARGTS